MLSQEDLQQVLAFLGTDPGADNTKNIHRNFLPPVSNEEGAQILKQWGGVQTTTPPVVVVTPAPAPTPTPTPAPAPAPTVSKPVAVPGTYNPTSSNSIQLYGKPDGANYEWRYVEGPGFDGWWNNSGKSQNPTMLGLKNGTHKVGLTVTVNGVRSEEAITPVIKK